MISNRLIFDTVKAHLLKQNKRAIHAAIHRCMYRTADGLKCAVGCLIPDDKYVPWIENCAVRGCFARDKDGELVEKTNLTNEKFNDYLKELGFTLENLPLLAALQDVHDYMAVHAWEYVLSLIEKEFFKEQESCS